VTEHIADWTHYTEALVALWPAKAAIAVVATWLATEPALLYWLAIMWGADWGFGLYEAFHRKKFSCRMLKRGALKFPAYCVYIVLVAAVDACIEVAFHVSVPLLEAFLAYLVAQESISVMGHMIRLGLPVPPIVRRILMHGKRKVEKQIDNILDDEKKD
jgi:phage-related holin